MNKDSESVSLLVLSLLSDDDVCVRRAKATFNMDTFCVRLSWRALFLTQSEQDIPPNFGHIIGQVKEYPCTFTVEPEGLQHLKVYNLYRYCSDVAFCLSRELFLQLHINECYLKS